MRLTQNIRALLQQQKGDEVMSEHGGEFMHVVEAPSTSRKYLCVDGKSYGNTSAMIWELFGTAILAERIRIKRS